MVEVTVVAQELREQHHLFQIEVKRARGPVAVATLLVLAALIVIGSACFCLGLPGVNVIQDVLLPGVLPGCAAILLSLPLIYKGIKISQVKTRLFDKELYPRALQLIEAENIEKAMPEDKGFALITVEDALREKGIDEETIGKVVAQFDTIEKLIHAKPEELLSKLPGIDREGVMEAIYDAIEPHRVEQAELDRPLDPHQYKNLKKETVEKLKEKRYTLRNLLTMTAKELADAIPRLNEDDEGHKKEIDLPELDAILANKIKSKYHSLKELQEAPLADIQAIPDVSVDNAQQVYDLAKTKMAREILSEARKKRRVIFVESHLFTLYPARSHQDYFRHLVTKLTKELGEKTKDLDKENPAKKKTDLRTKALTGALENIHLPPHKERN